MQSSELLHAFGLGQHAFGVAVKDAFHHVVVVAELLPFTEDHALNMFELPLHHRDPFDRQIIAQALAENIPVVTGDEQFRLYKPLSVIW